MRKVWRDVRRSLSRPKDDEDEIEIEWFDTNTTHIFMLDMRRGNLYKQLQASITRLHSNFDDFLKWDATAPQQQYWYITDEKSLLFAIKWETGRRVFIKTEANLGNISTMRYLLSVLLNVIDLQLSLPRGSSKSIEFQGRSRKMSLIMSSFRRVLPYYEDDYLQAIGVKLHSDPTFRLFIILPKDCTTVEQCEEHITGKKFLQLFASMWYHMVDVSLPKFNISDQHNLNEKLERLKVLEMTNKDKKFPGKKCKNDGTTITSLLCVHSVRLAFNNSSEDCKCTMDECDEDVDDEPIELDELPPTALFIADRPFLYVIIKNSTLLLIGRVKP
ncbi:unnamed protein product [Anisakis simplex]|uniref:SERPIN domain-containing protein n=1 Tax=Anisakis simplex TaxID=6269 RepID=A0A0M3JVP1_ANISI|nr:unnamed protein product [Anisakis simplex]